MATIKSGKIIATISLFLFISSCDFFIGEDGSAAIAYSWMGDVSNITTDDTTMLGHSFYNGQYYYPAIPGTYYYSYYGEYEWFSGYYTIYIEEGEMLLDGDDMCFELYMYSYIGPSFYEWTCDYEGVTIPNISQSSSYSQYTNDMNKERKYYNENDQITLDTIEMSDSNVNFSKSDIDNHPDVIVETGGAGKYRFIHKYIKK